MKIVWADTAEADLNGAYVFVARDNVAAAERLIETIYSATVKLAAFPLIGKEGRTPGTRELVIAGTPFFVSYKVQEEAIEIVAVIHGARRWPD